MSKKANKTSFYCKECGFESIKWLGQCPSCGSWNTFVEAEKVSKTITNSLGINTEAKAIEPKSLSNIEDVKEERITIVKNLSNEEAVKYLENKLNVNKIDSLTFFSDSILGKVNALIEEGIIVKEELKNADSIIVAQDSLIQDQDSLINVILERETEELNFYEKQTNALNKELKKEKKKRKFFQGTTIISGIIVLLLL